MSAGAGAPRGWPTRPRIAVVDDTAEFRLLAATALAGVGKVSQHDDGAAALAAFAREAPDVVVLDIDMPGLDGVAVLRRLREVPALARVPVVAFTASATAEHQAAYRRAGFDGFVAKPLREPDALVAEVRRVLARGDVQTSG